MAVGGGVPVAWGRGVADGHGVEVGRIVVGVAVAVKLSAPASAAVSPGELGDVTADALTVAVRVGKRLRKFMVLSSDEGNRL